MTTPARNIQSFRVLNNHFVVVDLPTGHIVQQGDITNDLVVLRDVRPASSSNPKRPDGTRKNGGWSHTWSTASGLDGMFTDRSGTRSEITTRGPLMWNGTCWPVTETQVDGCMRNARLKALAKATQATAQSNAALAQAKDLVKMSRQYLERANRGLDNLWQRHGKDDLYKQALREGKNIPDDYLAYLYGIAPLGDDIAGCLDRLTTARTKGFSMSMVLRAQEVRRNTIFRSAAIRHGTGTRAIRFPVSQFTACRVGYRFDLPSWFLDQAPTVAPFSTAYELARYSFVLDWFLPVGNYMGALESAQFSPFFKEGFEVWIVRESADLSQAECTNGVRPRLTLAGRCQSGKTVRTVINSYPSSVLTRPALNPFPGVDKIAQGLSLLTQQLKRWR